MGFLDILPGVPRPSRPKPPPRPALRAAVGGPDPAGRRRVHPDRDGAVCFASVEGGAFAQAHQEVQELLDADAERTGPPVEVSRDEYGYSWLVSRRYWNDLPALVSDLHAVNSALEGSGFGPQLLCSVAGFQDTGQRRLGLVYLYKRGTFYPFAPLAGEAQRRDNALELQVKAALAETTCGLNRTSAAGSHLGAPGL